MSLWHLLLASTCIMPVALGLNRSLTMGCGFWACALTAVVTLAVGFGCALLQWRVGNIVGQRALKMPPFRQAWCFRALYASALVWLGITALIGRLIPGTFLK